MPLRTCAWPLCTRGRLEAGFSDRSSRTRSSSLRSLGDCRERGSVAARRAERLRVALHVSGRAGLVARPQGRLGGGEADRRAGDDRGDLPRVRVGALRRLAPVGARGGDQRSRLRRSRTRRTCWKSRSPTRCPRCPLAITAAIATPTRRRLVLAGAICLVAPFVRGELALARRRARRRVIRGARRSERHPSWRATWSDWRRVGAVNARRRRGGRPQRDGEPAVARSGRSPRGSTSTECGLRHVGRGAG